MSQNACVVPAACIGAATGAQNHSNGQGAEDKMKMTQNQVYGVRQSEEANSGSDITMQANVVYGVNEKSSPRNPETDAAYDYI